MPKDPYFETSVHQFLLAAQRVAQAYRVADGQHAQTWEAFIRSLTFRNAGKSSLMVGWEFPKKGIQTIPLTDVRYYVRGDLSSTTGPSDAVYDHNARLFSKQVLAVGKKAGLGSPSGKVKNMLQSQYILSRFNQEEDISDEWVKSVDIGNIDVRLMNESPTAPEMRSITQTIGNFKGKKILDVGCGLGEASVYFALKGARVTAFDISKAMVDVTKRLAKQYQVRLKTYVCSIEQLAVPTGQRFDVIYVGNLFHHVHIEQALDALTPHLKPNGMLISWDPVDYNPVINVYRSLATNVRSRYERPFRLTEINKFKKYFGSVSVKWFWLTTLIIFVLMYVVERRDPNKERYWKVVVKEGDKWKWLYTPLKALDDLFLAIFPFLRPLCWNVVLVCRKPK